MIRCIGPPDRRIQARFSTLRSINRRVQDFTATPGHESVDLHDRRIVADLNERWPFCDGEVGIFRAHNAIEHFRDPIHMMKELRRGLAPQGWLLSQPPSTDGRGAFQDLAHVTT